MPRELAEHEIVRSAWRGLDPSRVWDSHVHLVGTGDSNSGIVVNPDMESLLYPGQYARRIFFLNAGCAHNAPGSVDRAYVERLHNLMEGMPRGLKLVLYAFDRAHDENGAPDWKHSTFYVPDSYTREVARAHPQYFEWVASVHPYRPDALDALAWAKREGARGVKWLPSAMGIDPASPRCDAFYSFMARNGMPLIAHAGAERAVLGSGMHDYGNPLRFRRALEAGVRVVIAHCASMGEDRDLDKGPNGPYVDSFLLFARMMDDARYPTLHGDIAAMTQANRAGPALITVIERSDWHTRLLNGSDYPLPGVMPIFSMDYLVNIGLLDNESAPLLTEIRRHNPLLFDLVLKRRLRSNGKALSAGVFETRAFFDPSDRKTDRKRM